MMVKKNLAATTRVCPLCGHDDVVTSAKLAPGIFEYSCAAPHADRAPWVWQVDVAGSPIPAWDGVLGELGLYEDLPRCVPTGDAWAEYGVVEYLYAHQFPDRFREVLNRHKHRDQERGLSYTASMLIVSALARLAREGPLVKTSGKATGYWSYDGEVSYWAHAPGPAGGNLSWEAFAPTVGVDPKDSGLADLV